MIDARWDALKRLLNETLQLPRAEWSDFLDRACDDPDLRESARRRLFEASQLDSFLQENERQDDLSIDPDRTVDALPPTLAHVSTRDDSVAHTRPIPAPWPTEDPDEYRPTYELVEFLGGGGFGEVFRANQLTPVRRPVAIKYLRRERAGWVQDVRFEAERQALASLSHPGIAKILDAGRSPDGRPYFSMEYVEGVPLDKFCDERCLSVHARLELVLQLCDAIQHAHYRGIIHRDLKPENVLAFEREGVTAIQVIDLGLAVATEAPLSERAKHLREGRGGGTLTHMSPEQWKLPGDRIDTRTDVYSIGVILYEMLVGVLPIPFPPEASPDVIGEALISTVPDAPRDRFLALPGDRQADLARRRGVEPRQLVRELSSDMSAIVAKALAKEPEHRYPSPEAIAADIRRMFAHETLTVHPSSLGYQTRKFVRRNRGAVIAAGAILLTATIGLSTTSAFWAVARGERALSQLLKDGETVVSAPAQLETLWPIGEDIIEPLGELRTRLEDIAARAPQYEKQLVEGARDSEGELSELVEFRDEILRTVLTATATFEADDGRKSYPPVGESKDSTSAGQAETVEVKKPAPARGLLTEIDWRLEEARSIDAQTRTDDEARRRWSGAIAEIAELPRYAGIPRLEPQRGLLPLGVNEESGLYEFWHVLSGVEPQCGLKGRYVVGPEEGIVLVLIPGGEYAFGCQNPLGLHVSAAGGKLSVSRVIPGTVSQRAEIAAEDQILAVDDVAIETEKEFSALLETLLEGGKCRLTVRSGDEAPRDLDLVIPPPGPRRHYDALATYIEGPTQEVTLDPYFISKYEVTQAQWVRWTGTNPSTRAVGGASSKRAHTADQPVENISWEEATRVLAQMDLGLPSEAQWEVACRAGTVTPWFVGTDPKAQVGFANICDLSVLREAVGWSPAPWIDDGFPYSAPVGSFEPNGNGLHDIAGNVFEWCFETGVLYSEPGYEARDGDGRRPEKPNRASRIMRGGGYENRDFYTRSSYRWNYDASGGGDIGVRPVRQLDSFVPPEEE